MDCLPEALAGRQYFVPQEIGDEADIKRRLDQVKQEKEKKENSRVSRVRALGARETPLLEQEGSFLSFHRLATTVENYFQFPIFLASSAQSNRIVKLN
jgi:hypothetical protein